MANEGSTKPEPFVTLSYGGTFTAKNVEDALRGAQAELDKANAENLRVRGLLQRGYHLVNVAGSCADEPEEVGDKWMEEVESELKTGAESADIGKLDSADKSGVEMGKVKQGGCQGESMKAITEQDLRDYLAEAATEANNGIPCEPAAVPVFYKDGALNLERTLGLPCYGDFMAWFEKSKK